MGHPAAEFVRAAADELQTAVAQNGGLVGAHRELDEFAADAFGRALTLLKEAEGYLAAGPGEAPAVAEGMKRVREASDAIESTRGFVRWMPAEVVYARADALRLLDRLTGRW